MKKKGMLQRTALLGMAITAAMLLIVGFYACKKLDIKRITKCTLENATVVDATTVQVVLDVYDLKDAPHSAHGVCYSKSYSTPVIADNKKELGSIDQPTIINTVVENLDYGTAWYFRGYVMDGEKVIYSDNILKVELPYLAEVSLLPPTAITAKTTLLHAQVNAKNNSATITFEYDSAAQFTLQVNATPLVITGDSVVAVYAFVNNLSSNTTYHLRAKASCSMGTRYSEVLQFTTSSIMQPSLITYDATNITQNAAVCTGRIFDGGGLAVLSRGICWDTLPGPTMADSYMVSGADTGTYTCTLTNLNPSTYYYARAYAINENGTFYGNEIAFTTFGKPIVTTAEAIDIAQTTALCGGAVTFSGGYDVTARGVCWSTTQNPTTANSHTSNGTGTGSFTSSLTGLTANTTYYVRAYATNSVGTAYGNEITFNTLSALLPTLTTTAASNITQTSATSGGNISSAGGGSITARGVCWSSTQNPTTASSHTNDGTGTGIFTSNLTGLAAGTTYYVRAYATNSAGTAYGNQISFFTPMLAIGDSYAGGIVAYILQSWDPGYIAEQTHGLIAAPNDQSTGIQWYNGTYTTTGATATAIGTGNMNTNAIVANQGSGSYAAKLCADLVLGGYSDWYLPSKDELNKLYINRTTIGGFANGYYWSSSEYEPGSHAWVQTFIYGNQSTVTKDYTGCVRAVRAF